MGFSHSLDPPDFEVISTISGVGLLDAHWPYFKPHQPNLR
jgi:hypothetical protein